MVKLNHKIILGIILVIFASGILIVNQQATATGTTSTISGKLTDVNGTGIIVKAELVQGNIVYHVASDINGNYSVTLPNGQYTLKFSDFNQTIKNAPAYYQVEKTITISSSSVFNQPIVFQKWTGSGLRNSTNALYNGMIQIHVPLNLAGVTGMSGDLVNVVNGVFSFKLLAAPATFTPTLAGQNLGANVCTGTSSTKIVVCS